MICAVKSLKAKFTCKLKARSEFSNVWGEYKNHSNPYIQGTTVPCDYIKHQEALIHDADILHKTAILD